MTTLVIDNYDSFTFNVVQYLSELGARVEVYRNDQITVKECMAKKPRNVVISPGELSMKGLWYLLQTWNLTSGLFRVRSWYSK